MRDWGTEWRVSRVRICTCSISIVLVAVCNTAVSQGLTSLGLRECSLCLTLWMLRLGSPCIPHPPVYKQVSQMSHSFHNNDFTHWDELSLIFWRENYWASKGKGVPVLLAPRMGKKSSVPTTVFYLWLLIIIIGLVCFEGWFSFIHHIHCQPGIFLPFLAI